MHIASGVKKLLFKDGITETDWRLGFMQLMQVFVASDFRDIVICRFRQMVS